MQKMWTEKSDFRTVAGATDAARSLQPENSTLPNADTSTSMPPASNRTARRAQRAIGERVRAAAAPIAIAEQSTARKEVERRDRLYRRMLAYADVLAALTAVVIAAVVVGDDRIDWKVILTLPLIVVAAKTQGLYDRDELLMRKSTLDEAPHIFQLSTLYTLLAWLLDGLIVNGGFEQREVIVLWTTLFVASFVGRILARRIATSASQPERCIFIGDAATYARLVDKIDGSYNVDLVGRMSLQRVARRGARNHGTQELNELIGWTNAHRIIIEPQTLPAEDMLDLVRAAKGVGVRVSLLPRVFDVVGTSVVFDELGGMTVLGIRRFGLTRSSTLLKRAFDVVGASIALLVGAPLLLAIAVAIKLDSRGPVLFRQTRIGRGGRAFRICKFRTMVPDAEQRKQDLRAQNEASGGMFKIADDPRITRVGRFLRKTSLDELPQLLNVLGGSMSLVGPRPLVVDEDERVTGHDRNRLVLTPGMTGGWQILGSSRVPMPEMLKIDYLYVAGWSLWTDLKILLRTVPYMLARRGL